MDEGLTFRNSSDSSNWVVWVWVQVRSQLQQELSLKQEAFVQVERLQGRLSDMEAALSRSTSTTTGSQTPALVDVVHIHTLVRHVLNYKEPLFANLLFGFCFSGQSRSYHTLSASRLSSRSPSAGTFTLTFRDHPKRTTALSGNESHHSILNLFLEQQ